MKRISLVATAALALTLAACGSKTEVANKTTTTTTETTAPAGTAAPGNALTPLASGAQNFANTAAASDAFEIASSQLAATHASAAKVKSFAAQMIKAHEDSTARLTQIAAGLSAAITPVSTLDADQQSTLDALRAKNGADFDAAYADAQVDAHQHALDGLRNYSQNGDVPELKSFAASMVPTVAAHLNGAKGLKK